MLPNPITEGRADEWQRMIETNLAGPLRMVRAFGRTWSKRPRRTVRPIS
jgi:NAD(P)-dependent dehydrogenase (short-subunit alcohol dehydrogenase family)